MAAISLALLALALPIVGGLIAVALPRSNRSTSSLAALAVVAGAVLGIAAPVPVLGGEAPVATMLPWNVPGGAFVVRLDALAAWFWLPIHCVCALAAIYGVAYLPRNDPRNALHWLWFGALHSSMALVVVADHALLFFAAWEAMSLSSWFLVIHDHEREDVRAAGWKYLVASQLGAVCLLGMWLLLGHAAGDFSLHAMQGLAPTGVVFTLALVGFGTKAGLVPVHVWLPDAHPAAPSHVSAVMSGVMLKVAIYGLLRVLGLADAPPSWWGIALMSIGIVSGVLGVASALAQHDLKRLLAYHSIENIGIITLGLGLGFFGVSESQPVIAALGFGGALLHVVNHALFKGLLFLAAGAVVHATHTRAIDAFGGLIRRMPITALMFLVGAVAICALPPLNGFVSEFLVYRAVLEGMHALPFPANVPMLVGLPAVAVMGALALACFAKVFGIIFLGEPRTSAGANATDPPPSMLAPMFVLAGACAAIGLGSPLLLGALARASATLVGDGSATILSGSSTALSDVSFAAAILAGSIAAVAALRRALLRGKPIASGPTWGCGYTRPTARMQYNSSSFAQPLVRLFGPAVGASTHGERPSGLFPGPSSLEVHCADPWEHRLLAPIFRGASRILGIARRLQHGRLRLYVLYIGLTLVGFLAWSLR